MTDQKTTSQDGDDRPLSSWSGTPFLEKVTRIAPSIIYVFNQATQSSEYSNRSLAGSIGYTPEEVQEMGASMMPRLCHPDDLAAMGAHFQRLQQLKDGEELAFEYRLRHREGHWVWLSSNDTVFERDENGAVLRHIGVATDITAVKLAEEKAHAEAVLAQAANEELRAFAYSLSHDLKSPSNTLDVLLSELRLGQWDRLDRDGKELLDLSQATVERVRALIEDVLRYTRVIGEPVEFETVAVGPMIDAVLQDLQGDIRASEAKITVGEMNAVLGHPSHIQMLLMNLIGNALKYRKPDVPPEITVTLTAGPKHDMATLTVADNGIGLPAGSHDRIFGMFGRLHLQDEYSGTGLGLAICRRIALAHGGNISVTSTEGQGAAFSVTLKTP